MPLLRLFIVAALIYALVILIRSIMKGRKDQIDVEQVSEQDKGQNDVQDVLMECPACHKLSPKKQAIRWKDGEEIRYFCSEDCCKNYEENQEEQK